jgi:hypothetical protein
VFIGLTTGNWITLSDEDGIPLLLARGTGHGPFKKKLLERCDEVFVLAPLGKVLRHSVGTLNEALGLSEKAEDGQKKAYAVVPPDSLKDSNTRKTRHDRREAIKLVSTQRTVSTSIMLNHSVLVIDKLRAYAPFEPGTSATDAMATSPIEALPHLLFPFDRFATDSKEKQRQDELPHAATRTPEFADKFFKVAQA